MPERWRRNPSVLWRDTLVTVLVLPPDADEPVALAASGPAVWHALAEPHTDDELVAELAAAFEADPAVVAPDIAALLDRLADLAVVERLAGPVHDGD